MPSELWNTDHWPSPSPEAIVRARVLGRARTIQRRRLAPVIAALLLASAAAVYTRLPGHESSSSHVLVTDNGEHESAAPPTTAAAESTAEVPAQSDSTKRRAVAVVAPGRSGPAPVVPAAPAAARLASLTFADQAGDAEYRAEGGCVVDCGPSSAPAGDALDIVEGRVVCPAGHVVASMRLASLAESPRPYGSTNPGTAEYAWTLSSGGWHVDLRVVRSLADGEVSVTAAYSDGSAMPSTAIDGAVAAFDDRVGTVRVDVPMSAVTQAAGHPLDLSQPVGVGLSTAAAFRSDTMTADNATSPTDNGVLASCG